MNQQSHPRLVQPDRPAYVYRHVVSFEETNVVGNVYFVRHLAWQGRCREMFLRDHAPDILGQISLDLRLVTLHASCEYFDELHAFDEVDIEMRLKELSGHRIRLTFEYHRTATGSIVAYGEHEIGCMQLADGRLRAINPPASFAAALVPYGSVSGQAMAPRPEVAREI